MKKRLLATLLSLCLVVGLLPVTAMAADGDTEGGNATQIEEITIEGSGTQESPYQLTSAKQLKAFAEGTLVNSKSTPVGTNYNDMYFHIAKQIDATDITIENPIYTAEHPFSGTIHFTSYTYSLSRDDVTTEYQRSFPVKSTSALMVVSSDGTAKGCLLYTSPSPRD